MSSSASSSLIKPRQYDVFLSFRGEDTRNCFTSHLQKELLRKEIETFIDNKLQRGDEISPALLTAIEESKILVIIFSRNYASSKWCLDELVKIMDCKKRNDHYFVVPVFYRIDPSEVRNQRGSFAEAFAKHEKNFKHDIQRVEAWRTALTEAANLTGWDSQVTWPESRLIDEIVNDILKKLNHGTSSCFEGVVGIERRMQQVMSLLCMEHKDYRKVGIWGMGGIGKTTLAEAIFNQISGDFQSSYFLRDVRDSEECGRLHQLRQEFLSTILEDGNLHVSTPTVPRVFKDRLRCKMALVVCDDVTDSRQLEFLFGGVVQLGPGSRIIITTRDRQVLIQNDIDLIYEVEELNCDESLKLFCQRAFKGNNLTEKQMQLSKTVLNFARGNPLAIKVIGSSVCGMDEQDMKSAVLNKLKQVPNPNIQKLLRWSYDALDLEVREIFLDIACFFKGENRDRVTRIMDACYQAANLGIENLIYKSFITVSQGNEIAMHDMLQEMGWAVVREESSDPERRSRLWDPNDIRRVLEEDSGTTALTSILNDMSRIQELELPTKAFANMRRLKYLKVLELPTKAFANMRRLKYLKVSPSYGRANVSLPQGLLLLPDELRYLRWEGYPLKTLPTKFCSLNLVELHMSYSNVEQLWEGKQDLPNLKVINLRRSASLIKIPDLSRATNLENLNLEYCKNLVELPSSVQYLEKLTHLDLTCCESLKSLPSLCKMRSLYFLYLWGCPNLIECPEISSNVRHLYLSGTAIEEVPSSIESLHHVTFLHVDGCAKLRNFPTAICHNELVLSDCPNISTFPVLSGSMGQLYLDGTAIEEVPSSIASLSRLYLLRLSNCKRLKSISTSIHKLKYLATLELDGCSRLEIFPEILETMESLNELDLSGTALKELPSSIENLIGLRELRMNNCENLVCLPDSFSKLKSLKDLHLNGCTNLFPLPELPASVTYLNTKSTNCSSLIALYLQGNYERIPPLFFQRMVLLQVLDLSHTSIKSFPESLPKLVALKKLLLRGCDLFMELSPQVGKLKNLEEIDLDETQIMDLPREIGKLVKLRHLKVSFYHICGKKKLKSNFVIHPETISNLSQLAELSIDVNPADKRWDDSVEAVVKEVCNSKTLRTLSLYLPKFQLLDHTSLIYASLSRFRFTVGHHKRSIISRVPHDVEAAFRNWDKCLRFVNGENIPIEIKGVLKYSSSFFLDHHATVMNLSEFGIENMKRLKFCLLAECNKMETLIDGEMHDERNEDNRSESDSGSVEHVLESLEYLSIYYMENLSSIWRGPNRYGCMSKLKFLALHACPNLTVIFPHTLLENFVNLEEVIVEDCPLITSLVSHASVKPMMADKLLPRLKRLLLLFLPGLGSISNGLLIAPKLESIGFYNCPKLKCISKMELSSKSLKMIKGESRWWEDMNWNETEWGKRPDYLMRIFSPINNEKDIMTQLAEDRDLLEATIQNEGQQLDIPASVTYLNANDCTSLEEVTSPNISTFLVLSGSIRQLYLGGTEIEEVPSSIASLSELAVLNLSNCRRLRSISTSIHKLKSLETFVLAGCSRLEIFPEILETMERLERLDLSRTALKELPSSIENLIGLREVKLNNCENLAWLPDSFSKLKSLEDLHLNGCTNLFPLPDIPASVTYLNANDCTSLEEVTSPNISTFLVLSGSIRKLYLGGTEIEEVPSSIASLSRLYLLRLSNCRRLRSISTSIHKLKYLATLELDGCSRLEIFPEILETMERLERLDLSGTALNELPSSIENLIGLRELKLNNCENLACLPDGFSKLKSLWYLYLNGCTNLVTLPELPASVKYLDAHDCTSLEEVTSPKNLFAEDAHDCTSLEEVTCPESLSDQENMGETFVRKVWLFSNCFLLDRQAVGNLGIPKSQMLFGHMVTLLKEHHHQGSLPEITFITCVPGGEIPECFDYKSLGSSITVQLPSEWCNSRKSFSGFIASVVVSFPDCSEPHEKFGIRCELRLKSCDGTDCVDLGWNFPLFLVLVGMNAPQLVGSTHLFLLYRNDIYDNEASDNCIYTEASFKFYLVETWDWSPSAYCEVKMCGVHLLFASDSDQNDEPPPKRLEYQS